MTDISCTLTARDHAILQAMLDRRLGHGDPVAALLQRKLDQARIVFGSDVPADVATLDSRVVYRVDGRESDTRIISRDAGRVAVGLFLSVASPRGLALLGLREGGTCEIATAEGDVETILLERVLYQPEAARRDKQALAAAMTPEARRRGLRLIDGAYADAPPVRYTGSGGFDDPGPSAA